MGECASYLSPGDYGTQIDLLTGRSRLDVLSERVRELMLFIDDNKQRQNVWPERIREYGGLLTAAQDERDVEAASDALPGFGPPPPPRTPAEIFAEVFR